VGEPAELRISDDDRERARTAIREHFAAGRLSEEEFADRVEAVYRARTQGELLDLQADLPRLPASPQQQRAALAARRRDLRRQVLQESGGGVATFVICTVIWAATGADGSFWPMWVGLVVLVSLVRNGWRLYGPAPELDRVEAELARRRRAERRRQR
jgi:Domain of unknown function (DUF1707)